MRLTKKEWFRAGKWLGVCLIGIACASIAYAEAFSTTTVQGTVYLANGTPGAGTLQLSWPAFTTANDQSVAAGRTIVTIGTDGFVSVNLAPNVGAMPGGLYYTAVYYMSDGTTSTEYWVVPAAAQATIAQVRAQVMPSAQAVHAVNQAYVDQAIQSLSQSYLAPSGGTLSGPLFLNSDPTQAMQAADKHYVDSQFGLAVPITGANMTGPLTSVKLGADWQADQFAGADFGARLQACLAAVSAVNGGVCDARNFTGNQSMASNLTISTANTMVMLPCATISTASQVIITAGTRNVAMRGCALRGASNASGSQGGTVFLYSGTGPMIQVGDPSYAADTLGFHLDNVVINTTAAGSATAEALAAYRTQELDLQSLYLLGNSNQTAMTLDGTGNYTGGTFYDNAFNGFQTAVNAVGHQVANSATTDWLNASTFVRLHIDCPTINGNPITGTYGINLQQGDGNTFTGGDVEGCDTAMHLGPNAQNNTIVGLRNENSNNQVIADSGSSYNNWITGGTMFTGKLADNGTRNSFLDTFHRSFNGINGDWYGSQQDATVTNHYRVGIGAGNERGLLNRYQTDSGYRWTTGLSDATAGEQFYQVLDELNNVYRLSIGQYNTGQPSSNNQTVINAAGTGAIVLNGSNNSGTGGVVIGSGGASEATVATISNAGNAQFNGTLQVGGPSTFTSSTTVRNQADAEIDAFLWAGATANQKESLIYKDYVGTSQWYLLKDASNNWALNSATGGLDSIKAYQSTNSGDTYINASNPSGVVRVNYETGAGTAFNIYGGSSNTLYAGFTGATSIKFPGLAASSGHNCVQIDDSGYITNTGIACGSGSGSGTVNSGATGQIAYYSGSGTALSGMSAVPVTSGGTGATSAGAALASLGAASLASAATQTFAGPINFGNSSVAATTLANLLPGASSDGSNGVKVTGGVVANSLAASSTNGVLNESYYPGATVTARVQAGCAALGGASGTVLIPATETSTDPAFAVEPVGCVVEDHRGIVYPVQSGYAMLTAHKSAGTLRRTFWNTAPTGDWTGTFIVDSVSAEAVAGGQNTYNGTTGIKTNYIVRNTNLFTSTPGQHSIGGQVITNTSPGDTYLLGAQIYDTGWASAAGDEGLEGDTVYLFAGMPALTAAVSSIAGSTLTMSCGSNCGQLGEQQPIVNTSRNVQSTGTATINSANPPVVTISGGSVTCPGGTNPCSSNTPGGVGLFFEFTGETVGGHHIVMPVITVNSAGTQLTLLIQDRITTSGPTNTQWEGKTTSGSYAVYRGTTISTVPYTAGVDSTIMATVVDPTQFQAGDSVMVPGGNNRNMNFMNFVGSQNVPCPSDGGCVAYEATSNGTYPMGYGVQLSGNWNQAPFAASWVGSAYTPIWGVNLYGVSPGNGYFEGADFTNLTSTEKMLCAGTHLSGANTCINLYRTSGTTQDYWQIPNVEFTGNVVFDNALPNPANLSNTPTATGQGLLINGYGSYSSKNVYMVEAGGYSIVQANEQLQVVANGGSLTLSGSTEAYLDGAGGGYGVQIGAQHSGEVNTFGISSGTNNFAGTNKFGSSGQTQFDGNGVKHEGGTAPTASAGTVTGTNAGGYISGLSAATSLTITFANSGWTTWASCVANTSSAAAQPYIGSISKTAVTFNFASLTGTLYYHCEGN